MDSSNNSISVTIVTPGGVKKSYNVKHVRLPGIEGEFGVLMGHVPFVTALKIGTIYIETVSGEKLLWATTGGFVEVLPNQVVILAETAELADSIDYHRAIAARDRALERIAKGGEIDANRAKLSLSRALNRIRIASNKS